MGTDIHSVGQVLVDNKWQTELTRVAGDNRCYDSFAAMADIRNGSGFAGCDIGEGWRVLFPPRGLPNDTDINDEGCVSLKEPYYYFYDRNKENPEYNLWLGDHSYSWLTLAEMKQIMSFYEERQYEVHGMISAEQKKRLDEGSVPEEWCGWTNQSGYVTAKWKVPAKDQLTDLANKVEALEALREKHQVTDSNVRIVFGFDS